LQTAVLAYLLVRISRDPAESRQPTPAADASEPGPRLALPPALAGRLLEGRCEPDEHRLRQLLREELAELRLEGAAVTNGHPAAPPQPAPRDETADRLLREEIAGRIDHFRAVGTMTDDEMEGLQASIARLGKADRREMTSALMRALNQGEISGRVLR
jgi:hypothetical protein